MKINKILILWVLFKHITSTIKEKKIENFNYDKYKGYVKNNEFILLLWENEENKLKIQELENLLDLNNNIKVKAMILNKKDYIYDQVIDQFNIKEFPYYILYSKRRINEGNIKNLNDFIKLIKFEVTDNLQLIKNTKDFQDYIFEDYTQIKLFLNLSTLDDKLIDDFKKLANYLKKESKYSIHCSVIHIDERYHKLKGKKFYDKPILFINQSNQNKFIPLDIEINDHYNYLENIEIHKLPTIFEVNDTNLHLLYDNHINDFIYLIDTANKHKELFNNLSLNNINNELFNERLIFVYINNLNENSKTKNLIEDLFGDSNDNLYLTSNKKGDLFKYKLTENLTMNNFTFFIEKFRNSDLKFYSKSEPIDGTDDIKIVASNFDEKVKSNKNNVLVLYCKDFENMRCKNSLSFLRKLSETNKYPDVLNFGYVNLLKNDIINFKTNVDPVFVLYNRKSKNIPKIFDLDFNIDVFVGWLNTYVNDVKIEIKPEDYLHMVYEISDENEKKVLIDSLKNNRHNFDIEEEYIKQFLEVKTEL